MRKLQAYFVSDFTIFAVLVLLQALMHQAGIADIFDSRIVIQYFIMSSVLAATELLIKYCMRRYPAYVKILVTIAAAFLEVVVLGGMVMQWYHIRMKWVLISLALCVIITMILYFISGVFTTKQTADQVNRVISLIRQSNEDSHADKS